MPDIDTVKQPLIASPEAGRVHRRWIRVMEIKAETFEEMAGQADEKHEAAEFGSYTSGSNAGRAIAYELCAETLHKIIAEMQKFVER